MTQSQEEEFDVLGCKVKFKPSLNDNHNAKAVIDLVVSEIQELKLTRPLLRDTDVAVLVALKMATERMRVEDEYQTSILKLEETLEMALQAVSTEAN